MRIVFMGTPDFAVPSLRALAGRHEVSLVVTRPDAVRGRGKKLVPSAVKAAATELGLSVLEASRMSGEALERVREAAPDCIVVAAYGCILPQALLDIPRMECVNVHASLLPRWRGAAPIQRAILAGDERAGVSIMRVVAALDAGAYCRQASVPVGETPCPELMAELASLGAKELLCALDQIEDGSVRWTEQDESRVTYAHKVEKAEMHLDPAASVEQNRRVVQASMDAAPARLSVAGRGLRALLARADASGLNVSAGSVLVQHGRVWLGCSDGALELTRVKPDGKREMDAKAWASGLRGEGLTWARE
ncbi:MAG: methionyl-tRNA formyltransferase [Tractidigestivibacter sp.]|jgi:methionyl-tRNA formyltransferase|uniref:methionyl-tRNA formyltransferase n=1 Tax=Tractidigestivibacter sp. TaxID=2847320 RepID=UPI003D8F391F